MNREKMLQELDGKIDRILQEQREQIIREAEKTVRIITSSEAPAGAPVPPYLQTFCNELAQACETGEGVQQAERAIIISSMLGAGYEWDIKTNRYIYKGDALWKQ